MWRSDGTAAGTHQVPGPTNPYNFAASGRYVYFTAWGDSSGYEMWRSDGTATGTTLVADLYPGTVSADTATTPIDVGGIVYYAARTALVGPELFKVTEREVAPPLVTSAAFAAAAAAPSIGQELRVTFSGDVATSLVAADLRLQNLTTGATHAIERLNKAGDVGAPTVAAWRTAPAATGGILPDGNYRATIGAADVVNDAGLAMPADYAFDFFVLAGDANRDRRVDDTDLAIFNGHLGATGATFAQGDFNYDAVVNAVDRAILEANWHVWLSETGTVTINAPTNDGALRIERDVDPAKIGIGAGAITWRLPLGGVSSVIFEGAAGDDMLAVDLAVLPKLEGKSLNFSGGPGTDTLTVLGTTAAETLTLDAASVTLASATPIRHHTDVESVRVDGGGGWDRLIVGSGPRLTITGQPTLELLSLASGTSASLDVATETPLVMRGLAIDPLARLDVGAHDLILDYTGPSPLGTWNGSAYTGITGMIARGYQFGAWNGDGIVTSMPRAVNEGVTGLAVAEAADVLFIAGDETAMWGGETVDATTVILNYTYVGDTNLDGLIDGADYGIIDNYVQFPGTTGYANGDFNYDGVIDGADYGLIDNVIQLQG